MSTTHSMAPTGWLVRLVVWPIRVAWRFTTWFVGVIGILLALLIGFACMALGVILCYGVITAFLGIPVFVVGLLLVLRALY